jgi:serine/threonine protein kinase
VPDLDVGPEHGSGLLGGRYHLGEEIGRGGMGVVHRAWDAELSRHVAVKILRDRADDPGARARFRVEGETLARLSHPHLISVFDAATDGAEPYLVMELVDGESLAELGRGRWLEADVVAGIGADVAEALEHVHAHRIVHRDVKPGNVLIGPDGNAKLADFGVARLLDGFTRHTATGVTIGTARYLSPEQVRGEALTGASDIYALGLVLIEALSGEPAFAGTWDVVALARLTTSPRIDEFWPEPLRGLLIAMTAIDPLQRPTAAEVAAVLRGVQTGTDLIPTATLVPPPLSAAAPVAVAVDGPEVDATRATGSRASGILVAAAALVLVPALILGARLGWDAGLTPDSSGTDGSASVTPQPTSEQDSPTPTTSTGTRTHTVELVGRNSRATPARQKKAKKPAADVKARPADEAKPPGAPDKAGKKGPDAPRHPPAGPGPR